MLVRQRFWILACSGGQTRSSVGTSGCQQCKGAEKSSRNFISFQCSLLHVCRTSDCGSACAHATANRLRLHAWKLGVRDVVCLVGDSLMRNFQESLLCLISADPKVNMQHWTGKVGPNIMGGVIVQPHNVVIVTAPTSYLVQAFQMSAKNHGYTVNLDVPDTTWGPALHAIDVLVFMGGHWYQQQPPGRMSPNIYRLKGKPLLGISDLRAYAQALTTIRDFVMGSSWGGLAYYMSYSPTMRIAGSGSDGTCGSGPLSDSAVAALELSDGAYPYVQTERGVLRSSAIRLLSITHLSTYRPEGHLGIFFEAPKKKIALGQSMDCTHWCLPGVPDAWVDAWWYNLGLEPSLQD
eukprot:SM000220S07062  [mRNA]  locus=s220:143500:145802:+ [translate_table: standard]